MDYIITMQYLENYGIHNDKPSHYWKPKGGEMYYIQGAPEREATVVACLNMTKANTSSAGHQFYIRSVERIDSWNLPADFDEEMYHEIEWADLQDEANKVLQSQYEGVAQ